MIENQIQSQSQSIIFPPISLIQNIFNTLFNETNVPTLTEEEFNNIITEKNEKLDECPICYNEFDNYVIINLCNHKFCKNCIKMVIK